MEPHTEESLPRKKKGHPGLGGHEVPEKEGDQRSLKHKPQASNNVKHTRPKRVVHLSFHIFLDTPKVG